jgi:hypothetical protein
MNKMNVTLQKEVGELFIKQREELNASDLFPFELTNTQFAQLILDNWEGTFHQLLLDIKDEYDPPSP